MFPDGTPVELVCRGFDLKAPRKIVEVPARSGRNGVVRGNLWTTHTHGHGWSGVLLGPKRRRLLCICGQTYGRNDAKRIAIT